MRQTGSRCGAIRRAAISGTRPCPTAWMASSMWPSPPARLCSLSLCRKGSLTLGGGLLRQVPDDGERISLVVAGLHQHENPGEHQDGFENLVHADSAVGEVPEQPPQHLIDNQPVAEQI